MTGIPVGSSRAVSAAHRAALPSSPARVGASPVLGSAAVADARGVGIRVTSPDSPRTAVAWFLKNDVHPDVTALVDERKRLVEALESVWDDRSKAERYQQVRVARLAARALAPQGGPIARRAAAAGVVLSFLWEREYGSSIEPYVPTWERLSMAEMAGAVTVYGG